MLSAWMLPAFAGGTSPGTTIDNTAYGSFENPADAGTVIPIQSNTVTLTVAEVAGISVTNQGVTEASSGVAEAGPAQGDGVIGSEDVLYFTYRITNIGNDATQFFIPDTPASIDNAAFNAATIGPISIVGYNDGTTTTPLSIDVTTGAATGTFAGTAPNGIPNGGSVPVDGYIDVQIPVKANAGLVPGADEITVVLGNTVSQDAADQNVQLDNGGAFGTGNNVNTVDNTGTANGDFAGSPVFEREASSSQVTAIGAANLDYGDAPDTTVDPATGDYQSAPGRGPSHVVGSLRLGSAVDAETTFSEDDGPPLEDDGVVVADGSGAPPQLHTQSFIAGQAYTLDVTTVGAGNLNAWIDFNQNGSFEDAGEQIAVDVASTGDTESIVVNVPFDAVAGSTYARFRYSTATSSGGLNSTSAAPDGEVEDYEITLVASNPALRLVKRITRVADAGAAPAVGVISDVNDDPGDTDDDSTNWPANFLQGSFESVTAAPTQVVDYTIYFLSDGNTPVNNVRLCDLIPENTTYVPDSLLISQGGAVLSGLTDVDSDDDGEFFNSAAALAAPCTGVNTGGGVYVRVPGTLENAVSSGSPTSSYGFIRFSVTVD